MAPLPQVRALFFPLTFPHCSHTHERDWGEVWSGSGGRWGKKGGASTPAGSPKDPASCGSCGGSPDFLSTLQALIRATLRWR
jgi:hypothetical protein